jgi:cytochrome c553
MAGKEWPEVIHLLIQSSLREAQRMPAPQLPARTVAATLLALAVVVCATNRPPALAADPPKQAEPVKAVAKLGYNRDVRPILAENCFACHGPDSAARKAGLRLDQREAAIESEVLSPGKPDDSEIIARILLPESDSGMMPPPKSHKTLTAKQKDTLKAWVAQGAEYQPHWSFLAPVKPPVPAVTDPTWVRTPIDAFVRAELEKRGLKPAPEADRRTLARRLSLDLTGLPPTPADVEAFVKDQSPNYYEAFVDKLMATPQWGEHRGRYWLDAARYADTHGIHFDNYRENWAYRDWVIRAFNENKPFDAFTTEQLAGDLLPNATLDQKVATGFNRSHITTNEGGLIDEEYLVLYTRDRTETMSQTWLGLTTGCAVCHDHKFDPVSQKDFYSLAAFFNNTTQTARDGNIKDTPPNLFVPAVEDREKFLAYADNLKAAQAKLDERKKVARQEFDVWLKTVTADQFTPPTAGLTFHAQFDEGKGKELASVRPGTKRTDALPAGATWVNGPTPGSKALAVKPARGTLAFPAEVGDFEADKPFTYAAWVQIPQRGQTGGVFAKMDEKDNFRGWDLYLQNDKFAAHLIHEWPGNAFKITTKNGFDPNQWHHVTVSYDGSRKPSGMTLYVNGDPQPVDVDVNGQNNPAGFKGVSPSQTTKTATPLVLGQRSEGAKLRQVGLTDFRLYDRALTGQEVGELSAAGKVSATLSKPAAKRTPAEVNALFDWWVTTRDATSAALAAELDKLKREEAAFRARGTVAPISVEKATPAEAFVLSRGDYDKRGEKVAADTPKSLPTFATALPRNRLGLAQWLLRTDHPLTARVNVNRFWQELYGQGLVRTAGDFGVTGEPPSHPELLDWMAEEFESHWDVKKFFKLMVTSATYRQAAVTTPEKADKDAGNRFLSRGPRFRMDAEMVRDYALAASGLMVPKIGGASVKPYQPDGVWEAVAMIGSNTRNYKQDTGDALYRRSLYTFIKRAAPPASMDVFNAPNRETCAVKRERTNTPLQALVTLNDVQMVEAARVLAEKALAAGTTDDARIDFIARRVLARPFRTDEAGIVKESLTALVAEYAAKPAEAKKLIAFGESKADPKLKPEELAAWTMLCNELLNLDEVLNK